MMHVLMHMCIYVCMYGIGGDLGGIGGHGPPKFEVGGISL